MKKLILIFALLSVCLFGCKKKEDDTVAIDMTLKTYSADAQYGRLPVIIKLNFESNGVVKLKAFPSDDVVNLKYEVGDKDAENTTLHIYGELDKTLTANGFVKGSKIDWTAKIGRLIYKPEIGGGTAGDYHFTSY
jgi:hypothetical protein